MWPFVHLIRRTNTMRNFILLPLFSILPLLVLSETSRGNKFSECTRTSYPCGADSYHNISYPFRVQDMPQHCGLPGYDVTCKNNNTDDAMLVLEIANKDYKVGSISYENQTINLINTDFLGDTCPGAFPNTTFDTSPFSYVEYDLNLTMYFHCSPLSSSLPNHPDNRKVSCNLGSNINYPSYYSLPDDDPNLIAEQSRICNSTALIPFLRDYWKQLGKGRVDLLDVLQHGFDLNWTSDATRWCKECKDAGGVCVRDLKSPGKPSCACNSGSTTNNTCSSSGNGAGNKATLAFIIVYLFDHWTIATANKQSRKQQQVWRRHCYRGWSSFGEYRCCGLGRNLGC